MLTLYKFFFAQINKFMMYFTLMIEITIDFCLQFIYIINFLMNI